MLLGGFGGLLLCVGGCLGLPYRDLDRSSFLRLPVGKLLSSRPGELLSCTAGYLGPASARTGIGQEQGSWAAHLGGMSQPHGQGAYPDGGIMLGNFEWEKSAWACARLKRNVGWHTAA